MQFKGKLMNQTWENGEKPNFRPHLNPFGPNLPPPQFFFHGFYLYLMLDIIVSCNRLEFQEKPMIQIQENGEKSHFGSDLGPLGPNSVRQDFFSKIWLRQLLDIMVSYYHVQCQKKLVIQSWENLVTDGQTDRRTDCQTNWSDLSDKRRAYKNEEVCWEPC